MIEVTKLNTLTSSLEGDMVSPKNSLATSHRKSKKSQADPTLAHFAGKSWISVVLKGQLPKPRCNMGFTTDAHHFYILGGQDLNCGLYSSLWKINLTTVRDNVKNANWEEVETRGDAPGPTSFHCIFTYKNKLFVFGGVSDTMKQKISRRRVSENNQSPMFHVLNL